MFFQNQTIMENQNSSSKQVMLNYGLILGVVSIILSVSTFALDNIYKPHWIFSALGLIAPIALIILGLREFKVTNNGYLKLGEAFKLGLGVALISAVVFLIYFVLFTNFIEPEFYVRSLEVKEQAILEMYPNLTDEQLEGAMDMQKKLNSPLFLTAMILIFNLFYGFIISLIGGLIMKKTQEED